MKQTKRVLSLLCCVVLFLTLFAACKQGGESTPDGSTDTPGSSTAGTSGSDATTDGSGTGVTDTSAGDTGTSGSSGSATGGNSTNQTSPSKTNNTSKTTNKTQAPTQADKKPADVGTIVPAGYGSNAWKPFGQSEIFSAKPLNTNFKTHATTQVKTVDGRTRLYINGKEEAPIMTFVSFAWGAGERTDNAMETIGHMMDAGANYVFVDVHINSANPNTRYATIKTQLEDVIYEYPDAKLIVRYTPWAPPSFYGLSEDHDITYKDGTKAKAVSIASDEWAEQAIQMTREMIAYLAQDEEVASHIIGYTPLVYNSGEWFHYNYWEGSFDISPVNTAKFREWLRYRYDNDVSKLRAAWGDKAVTFETAKIPTTIAGLDRNGGDNGKVFQLEPKYRAGVDYVLYFGDLVAYRIEEFARAVKLETNDKSLFISFYGYFTELFSNASGHFNMDQLLNCDDIDMLAGPVNYENRNEGGTGISMTYPNSVNANNKFWMDESDYRSFFNKLENGTPTQEIKTEEGMYNVVRRVMGRLMVEGSGTWWADIGSEGWFNDKDLWVEIKELTDLYLDYNKVVGKAQYDVAFILDEAGASLSGSPWNHFMPLLRSGRHQVAYAGLNFAAYTMNDLLNGKVDADLIVMTTCYSLNADQQKKLEKQVHKDGRTVLWNLGFGELTAAQVKSLTGMDIEIVEGFKRRTINLTANNKLNFPFNGSINNTAITPVTKVKTAGVTVLGSFDDGTPALSVKTVGKSTQVFYAGNTWSAEFLQAIAKMAGVNVYSETEDTFYANDSLAVIHTNKAGKKTITLPEKSDVYCYFTKKWYTGVTSVTLDMKANTTEYFFIGSQKELKAAGIGK